MSVKHSRFTVLVLVMAAALLVLAGCGGGADTSENGNDDAQKPEIKEWVFAADHEFSVRPDGLPELEKVYGFEFDRVEVMDLGVTYGALKDGLVPVAMGFATDGRIGAFNLVNLEDDKHFFPVYNPAPVVRKEVLDQYPEIEEILGAIGPKLDTGTMIELNGKVDIEGMEPEEVAREFLLEQGLIDEEEEERTKGPVTVGSKEFTEQLILGAMTRLALEDAGFKVEDSTGLGGTEMARNALESGEIDTYWEYTGTAWLVALGHEEPITDSEEAFQKVKQEDLEKNNMVWLPYAQFDNTYTLMMRKDDADALGIKTISDLAKVINESK